MNDVIEHCLSKGFAKTDIEECIENYEGMNVWHMNQTRTILRIV